MTKMTTKPRPPRAYVYGRVHGPGKKTAADVVNMIDDMVQDELDALDLTGLPITDDHPDDGRLVADQPHKVRGVILKTFNCVDGSKNILAAIDTDTYAGCRSVAGIMNGEIGLSLGHVYNEVQTESGKLVSRSFTGDHVALCRSPRRKGCSLIAAGLRASCLDEDMDKTGPDNAFLSDTQIVTASSAFQFPSSSTINTSGLISTRNPSMAQNNNSGQGQAPMDTSPAGGGNTPSNNPGPFPNGNQNQNLNQNENVQNGGKPDNMSQEQYDLLVLGEELDARREQETQWKAEREQMRKDLNEAKKILAEKESQEKAAFEKEKEALEHDVSMTADAWALHLKNIKDHGAKNFSKERFMESILPKNVQTKEELNSAQERHVLFSQTVAASRNQHELMMENEKLRANFFGENTSPEGEPSRKRSRIEGFGTLGSGASSSSSSSSSHTPAAAKFKLPMNNNTTYVRNGSFQSSKAAFARLENLREQTGMNSVRKNHFSAAPSGWRQNK